MNDLRTAAQQALERLRKYHYGNGFVEDAECIAALEAALAHQAEPVRLQQMADAGFKPRDRRLECDECGGKFTAQMLPIHKCAQQAEAVEPFGYWFSDKHQDAVCSGWFVRSPCDGKLDGKPGVPLYTAPPQRKPLTEKEMYAVEEEARKNFRLAQAGPRGQMITYWDSLTPWLIRAVERAHGIKE